MFSENFSDLRPAIYTYLGFRGVQSCADTDAIIKDCLAELEEIVRFRYLHTSFAEPPQFLLQPPYMSYLKGSTGVILGVMTLGMEADRRIKILSRTDMVKSVVFDACASACLEYLSDEQEKTFGTDLSYRFCPGYGGSDVRDLKAIFALLKPERIGVSLTETNYMLPSKSMAGIIAVGKREKKRCGGCILLEHCTYRKEGRRCYNPTN